ncbi:MAG TPA: pitrilysin family protein [Gemmatimonadaceae bacterium]|jgi:predicted Zn-dependent peptidase|nr:pitrilysin family protein [Gemmatimonadaceae bacterium]
MSRHRFRGIRAARGVAATLIVSTGVTLIASRVALAQHKAGGTTPSTLDRSVAPPAGAAPALHVPSWTKTSLANGARLVVVERHSLPLVFVNVNFIGGANQYEPADKTGLASFVGSMMLEGTTSKTGDQLSEAMQSLGSSINGNIGGETGSFGFAVVKDKLFPMLALLEDVVVNPSFPADALERLRGRTLINLQQSKDRTGSIAAVVFPKVLYTADEPYGRSMTEQSVRAIARNDLVAFHTAYFTPGHAEITVVGDVKADDVKQMLNKAFAGWTGGGSVPTFDYPAPPAPKPTTIFLVDKPGAAQSTFAIGEVGPPRNTPDYYPLRVMNSFFGELFQSRLNADIREQKGYSYGVSSRFAFGRGPGAFRAGGDIVTAKTDSALLEFMKQIRGIRGDQPITDEEMTAAKNALVQSLPSRFASVGGVNQSVSEIFTQGLLENYYQDFAKQVDAVTKDDVLRVARKYLDPDHMSIVIVGDRAKIEGPLEATKIAPIVVLDVNGNPVPDKVRP